MVKKDGLIRIHFQQEAHYLKVTIEDNGVGYYQSQNHKHTIDDERPSLGMSISQKRMKLMDLANDVVIKELKVNS